ncbi:lanthionine synthetase C family protein [Kibdelosporangium persicum]|uniref:Lanthionine biosynthesis cyclase LanC n=1 Tax=Kibdelosporangium persicum TaxID=2698649 RepID=A0ABX2FIC1_9PSEU|nr:lanthionine synthetase C family protein [Kibdelosporangium persicum]NRN70483.1 Lanthionine biosynthesis cyclase LanC [Kibdelosporangium persicum]
MTQSEDVVPPRDPAPGWGQSLAAGAAGIALLHVENAHAGTGSWETAHQWIRAMTREPVSATPSSSGLYRGAPAVAFTLHAAGQSAYATALCTLDEHIAAITRHRLHKAHERIDHGQLPTRREFDLISGLTGIGVVLLHRHERTDLLNDVLAYLVRLTEPVNIDGDVLPGWWCCDTPGGHAAESWPGGYANLGLAHGIAGPLTLMATAARRGIAVAGQTDAMDQICSWLERWRCGTDRTAWWPGLLSRTEWHDRTVRQSGPQRPSWCYGTPGLVRAQQLAALALADPLRQRRAEQALAGCLNDDKQLAQLRDASVCHGWAGLLQASWRTAADAADGELASRLPILRARLSRHVDEHGQPADPGLLEGRAGLCLVRQAVDNDVTPVTRWDACLLLGY